MPVSDFTSSKLTTDDPNYATKINAFMDLVASAINLKLDISAFTGKTVVPKTANFTVAASDYTIEMDASIASVTATLPSAAANTGRLLVFVRKDASLFRAIIDTVYELYIQNESVTLQSNGTIWKKVG